MKYIAYVLIDNTGKRYKGVTSDLNRRFREHLRGHMRTTSRMCGLRVAYTEEFDTFEAARKREVYFKTAAGRRFLAQKLGD